MKPKLAWAVKSEDGSYYTDSNWTRRDAKERKQWSEEKIVRVEIKEVKRKR